MRAARQACVEFELLEYEHDVKSRGYGVEAAEVLGLDPATVFKTLVVELDAKSLAVALVPVSSSLALKSFARALGAKRAAMADAALVMRATGYVLGGVSPLGQRKHLRTVIDASACKHPRIHVSAGRRGLEMRLAPRALIDYLGAKVDSIAAAARH